VIKRMLSLTSGSQFLLSAQSVNDQGCGRWANKSNSNCTSRKRTDSKADSVNRWRVGATAIKRLNLRNSLVKRGRERLVMIE
jgi:hypothetical protein